MSMLSGWCSPAQQPDHLSNWSWGLDRAQVGWSWRSMGVCLNGQVKCYPWGLQRGRGKRDEGSLCLNLILLSFSHSVMSNSLQPHRLQHSKLPCPAPSPGACWNSCALSPWCHPTISSSVVPFPSHLQSFPASGSFPVSWLFVPGSQSAEASALESVPPKNIEDSFPSRLTDWISLLSKGLWRVFSNTTVQKHQFLGAQLLYDPTLTSIHDYWKNWSFD